VGFRNVKQQALERMKFKSLEGQFTSEVSEGLNCSPFEAEAVLEVVREIFLPHLDGEPAQTRPGMISLVVVRADEPPGKSIEQCAKTTVCLKLHRGEQDDRIMTEEGPAALRRARIPDLAQQALSQGGLITREDLAYRIFFVSPRTISRDLKALREAQPERPIPLRSLRQDIGPVLTHRVRIVELALTGRTERQIATRTGHSMEAVANYVSTFIRTAQLSEDGTAAHDIAFLLERSHGLIEQYLKLLRQAKASRPMRYHLKELLRLGRAGGEKKDERGQR